MQLRNDQPINIRVLHELFREDCDVFMASGEQAITVCRTQLPDLILLDVVMEGMDGHEKCRRLKFDPAIQRIPIIFITAQQQESDEVLGLEAWWTSSANPSIQSLLEHVCEHI